MPIKGSPVVKDVYLDDQGNEYLPSEESNAYLDEKGNEVPAPPLSLPGKKSREQLLSEHKANLQAGESAYKPGWEETLRTQGYYGLGAEALKGAKEAIKNTPARLGQMVEGIGTIFDPEQYKSVAENPIVDLPGNIGAGLITGAAEASISPRTAGEFGTGMAADTLVLMGAGRAAKGIIAAPGRIAQKLGVTAPQRMQQGLNQIVAALHPGERTAKSLDAAYPRIDEFMQKTGAQFKDMESFAQTAKGAADDFIKTNYEPISNMLQDVKVKLGDRELSFGELEAQRETLNKTLGRLGYYDKNPIVQSLAKSSPQVGQLVAEVDMVRGLIDHTIDKMAPTNVGAANMLREYSHLKQVADVSRIKADRSVLAKRIAAGEQAPASELLKETAKTLGTLGIIDLLGKPQMATRIARQIVWNMTRKPAIDPDVLIARAANNLRKGKAAITPPVQIKGEPIKLPGADRVPTDEFGQERLPFVPQEVGGIPQRTGGFEANPARDITLPNDLTNQFNEPLGPAKPAVTAEEAATSQQSLRQRMSQGGATPEEIDAAALSLPTEGQEFLPFVEQQVGGIPQDIRGFEGQRTIPFMFSDEIEQGAMRDAVIQEAERRAATQATPSAPPESATPLQLPGASKSLPKPRIRVRGESARPSGEPFKPDAEEINLPTTEQTMDLTPEEMATVSVAEKNLQFLHPEQKRGGNRPAGAHRQTIEQIMKKERRRQEREKHKSE